MVLNTEVLNGVLNTGLYNCGRAPCDYRNISPIIRTYALLDALLQREVHESSVRVAAPRASETDQEEDRPRSEAHVGDMLTCGRTCTCIHAFATCMFAYYNCSLIIRLIQYQLFFHFNLLMYQYWLPLICIIKVF